MLKVNHGTVLPLDRFSFKGSSLKDNTPRTFPFGYMFPELQAQKDLLEESAKTVADLRRLGAFGMKDPPVSQRPGVIVPAIYTFFGQFVDHDITREKGSSSIRLANPSSGTARFKRRRTWSRLAGSLMLAVSVSR